MVAEISVVALADMNSEMTFEVIGRDARAAEARRSSHMKALRNPYSIATAGITTLRNSLKYHHAESWKRQAAIKPGDSKHTSQHNRTCYLQRQLPPAGD